MRFRAVTQTGEASDLKGELITFSESSLEDYHSICELSKIMTVDKLPIRQCYVSGWGEQSYWEYLDDALFLEQEVKSIDLLIGIDHPQASTFLESRYSPEGGPVAVKTPLGWTLFGPVSKTDQGKVTNFVSMHVQLVNYDGFSKSTITAPHVQVEEGELKCDNSQEEIFFFERMKSSIKLVNENFQLPLLWRNEDEKLPNNFEMAKGVYFSKAQV